MNPKLVVDVNKNDTKKGIKVQFVFPEQMEGDNKAELTQKIQQKLNSGLSQYSMTSQIDTDVPYGNVIGFLIPIADIKLLVKNAMTGASTPPTTPAVASATPEPTV
jgi:hypothetical protein